MHGAFGVIGRIVKDGELLRTIVIDGLEFLPQDFDRPGYERIFGLLVEGTRDLRELRTAQIA